MIPWSPDLNPNEYLWNDLECLLQANYSSPNPDFRNAQVDEWAFPPLIAKILWNTFPEK